MGPIVSRAQFNSIQRHIQSGIHEGARLVAGGVGRPEGFEAGFYTKPTVFVDVSPDMTIAREEIFGPVLAVIPYSTESEALEIANDSPYGLGGYVFSGDCDRGYEFAKGLRAGRVSFNGAETNSVTPMGGTSSPDRSFNGGLWGWKSIWRSNLFMASRTRQASYLISISESPGALRTFGKSTCGSKSRAGLSLSAGFFVHLGFWFTRW